MSPPHREFDGAAHDRWRDLRHWFPAFLVAAVIILYLPSFGDGFVWDDRGHILLNAALPDWTFLWKSLARDAFWFLGPYHSPQSPHYRPLWDIWLAANYHAFGLHPALWHAARIALHGLAAFLVFRTARGLGLDRWAGLGAALLFAALPIQVETVAWASTAELPAAILELGAFCLVVERPGKLATQAGSLLLFSGALLTYEGAVTFPAIVAVFSFFLGDQQQRLRRALAAAAPFAALTLVYLGLRLWVLGFVAGYSSWGGQSGAQIISTIPQKLLAYAGLLAAPWQVGPAHRPVPAVGFAAPAFWLPLLALATIGAALWWMFRRNPHRRLYLICAAWVVFAVAPALGAGGVKAHIAVQDRYLYFASAGWCIALADIASGAAARGAVWRATVVAGAATLAIACGISTIRAQRIWHDEVALFGHCVRAAPQVAVWHEGLGRARYDGGDLAGALREFATGVALDPVELADEKGVLFVLGRAFEWQHRDPEALGAYRLAVAVAPGIAEFRVEVARALARLGRNREALSEAHAALAIDPGDKDARQLVLTIEDKSAQ